MPIIKCINYKLDRLLELIIPVLIIVQVHTSIFWYNTPIIASLLVLVVFILSYIRKRKLYLPSHIALFALCLSFFIFILIHFQGSSIVTLIAFLSTFLISDNVKLKALNNLTNLLALIILISLPLWLIHTNGVFLFPLFRLLDLTVVGTDLYLEDYLFFIENPLLVFPRYYSIFEEPGIFALLLSFVLIANRFDFKNRKNIVIFMGLLFTYSLTGYIIATIGFFLLKIKNISSFLFIILIISFLGIVLYCLLEDVFTQLILNRIMNFGEHGINSRTDSELNKYYESFLFSKDVFLGKGSVFVSSNFSGDSYKYFVLSYGYIGLISIFLIWYSIYKCYKRKAKIILITYVVAFLPLCSVYISWRIILFSLACASLSYTTKCNTPLKKKIRKSVRVSK